MRCLLLPLAALYAAALEAQLISIDCSTCACTTGGGGSVTGDEVAGAEALDVTTATCQAECGKLTANTPIWDFYQFLVDIGPFCTVSAVADIPTELANSEWCEVKTDDKKGWVLKKPGQNNSVPPFSGITERGQGLFRIHQETADDWFCMTSGFTFQGAMLETTGGVSDTEVTCPLGESVTPTYSNLQGTIVKTYIEIADANDWQYDTKKPFYVLNEPEGECFGKVLKIDWQRRVSAKFTGMEKLPTTTPPTGFEKGGAAGTFAAAGVALSAYLAIA